ncbi:MAG: Glutaminase 2 [Gammaproteobacteria bacterium]|nr:Glutaminase 2 [Gammaproteobacteria bacterium]
MPMGLDEVLHEIAQGIHPYLARGKVASYIPALRRVPLTKFGMAVCMVDGTEYAIRDATEPFSIQSISKLFTLMLAMSRIGDEVWRRVGKEPSGTAFNSLVQLEYEKGIPRNPFINAGALTVLDCLMANTRGRAAEVIRDYARVLSRNFDVDYDEKVYASELKAAYRNRSIANLLRSHGRIEHEPEHLLDTYCRQCSLAMNCVDLARAFLPLANAGHSPLLRETVLTERQARRINAIMMTSGVYDSAGSFAFRVGLPAKSGVGGGIVAVVPRRCCIAVWSPGLDRAGNSLAGIAALEMLVRATRMSIL